MKRLLLMLIGASLLAIGGCASLSANDYAARMAACQNRVAYTLGADGNLVQSAPNCSHIQPTGGNKLSTGEMVAVGGVTVGLLFLLYKLIDENNASRTTTTTQQSPLVNSAGTETRTFSNTYITPTWGTVN